MAAAAAVSLWRASHAFKPGGGENLGRRKGQQGVGGEDAPGGCGVVGRSHHVSGSVPTLMAAPSATSTLSPSPSWLAGAAWMAATAPAARRWRGGRLP